jgi:hypothetical protein
VPNVSSLYSMTTKNGFVRNFLKKTVQHLCTKGGSNLQEQNDGDGLSTSAAPHSV